MVQETAIRFGLTAIKGIGSDLAQAIILVRELGGPYQSLEDFCIRVPGDLLNKRSLEILIKAGVMDTFPGTRHQKLAIVGQLLSLGRDYQQAMANGQKAMF